MTLLVIAVLIGVVLILGPSDTWMWVRAIVQPEILKQLFFICAFVTVFLWIITL